MVECFKLLQERRQIIAKQVNPSLPMTRNRDEPSNEGGCNRAHPDPG
jgi:hypothetical protein